MKHFSFNRMSSILTLNLLQPHKDPSTGGQKNRFLKYDTYSGRKRNNSKQQIAPFSSYPFTIFKEMKNKI